MDISLSPTSLVNNSLSGKNMSWPSARELAAYVANDAGLSIEQRAGLLEQLKQPGFLSSVFAGVAGASLLLVISRYLKLSPAVQVLLSMAGYGIGNLLLNATSNNMLKYDDKLKSYEIKSS